VGRAAGFSGPGAERLDDYRLGWILVSKVVFGSVVPLSEFARAWVAEWIQVMSRRFASLALAAT